MKNWISDYIRRTQRIYDALPIDQVIRIAELLKRTHAEERMIFTFGNGANAAHASHFAADLGKGASDKLDKPFRILSLNDNSAWMTAIGNDYSYEDVFLRQISNYAQPGDVAFTMSVSGSSPNCVTAVRWANEHGLHTVAIVGARRGELADLAEIAIVLDDTHYGRVEDVQIAICHMLAGLFIEKAI